MGSAFCAFISCPDLSLTERRCTHAKIIDDINGFMDVIPLNFTQNNEMIYAIKPLDLINWLKKYPQNNILLRKSHPWLNEIDEFSNPIIAIGKCKDR